MIKLQSELSKQPKVKSYRELEVNCNGQFFSEASIKEILSLFPCQGAFGSEEDEAKRRGKFIDFCQGLPTMNFRINWSISKLNTQVNPTTCLGDRDCWIQQVTTPTLVVTCWNQ